MYMHDDKQGQIEIGDNVLICPGTRIDSASKVLIKNNCMLAAGTYLTDADWHDIYDRTKPIGTTKPITLEENVWIGDSSIVCKGVTIGKNSVVGAGSVVATDIPSGVIAVGNPAAPIKKLSDEEIEALNIALDALARIFAIQDISQIDPIEKKDAS